MPRNDTFIVRDNRGPKYLKVYNDFYDRYGAELGPYGLALYMALCRYIDVDSSECNPSYDTLAKGTGMCRRKAISEIARMVSMGVIALEKTPYKPNVYILLDTSARHAPLSSARHAPPSAPHAPKQESSNKVTHRRSNKNKRNYTEVPQEEIRNYRPPEYADIIL
jgi:hypothetical protein